MSLSAFSPRTSTYALTNATLPYVVQFNKRDLSDVAPIDYLQYTLNRGTQRVPAFGSLSALNDWLADQCVLLWQQTKHPEQDTTIWDAWSVERPHLMPVGQAFDGFVEHTKLVSPTCLVSFDRNRYSVPAAFANRPISLHCSIPSGSSARFSSFFGSLTRSPALAWRTK